VREPIWIDEREVLALHDRLLALDGGAAGVRDAGLLKSALARPQQHFAYAEAPDAIAMATLYTAGIVFNHPFVDGNKRTGFVWESCSSNSMAIASLPARKMQRGPSLNWLRALSTKPTTALFFATT